MFLDFGQSFTFDSKLFNSCLQPRCLNGLDDYFEFNLMPKISGLYCKEMLMSTNLAYTEPTINAVFLSHAQKACFDRKRSAAANLRGEKEPLHVLQLKTRHS